MSTTTPEVDAATALVRSYCGWHIAPVLDEDATLDGPGRNVLILGTLRLVDVTSITEDGVLVDPTDYEWSSSGIIRRTGGNPQSLWGSCWSPRWSGHLRGLQVQFSHGYEGWPLEVQAVIDELSTRATATSGASLITQVGAVQYATGSDGMPVTGLTLSTAERDVLNAYKLGWLP